ncbi:hypothetical protein ACFY2R_14780 [Micromonospora olivasterospora]|uniref:hypothetical protein n=1 Tax=Micromonospora olivasterospora TaxID=1880 RepID=UPI001B863246|nr:hypothetical protein [Micromonospora olivasterospora]
MAATAVAVAATAVAVAATAVAVAATAVAVAATDPAEEPGGGTPGEPPTTDPAPTDPPSTVPPPPETTAPAPTPTEPVPPTPSPTAPTTTAAPPPAPSTPARTSAPGANPPASPRLGVRVTTGDVRLGEAYWKARRTTTTLRVTVANTGDVAQRMRLTYTLPPGLTDAGTAGCSPTGGGDHRCGEWRTAPGARFSALLRVRVDAAAWRRMPLSGTVRVSATAPGVRGSAGDKQGFAVLFPPGPPVPGIALRAGEVAFDIGANASELDVRLGNTGRVDAAGRVEVVLPTGVSVPVPPAGCAAVSATRTRCDVGTVPSGDTAVLRLPLAATAQAQRDAPLAGAVVGRLDPGSGRTRQVQMSFRITAAATETVAVATPAPVGSPGMIAAADPGFFGAGGSVRHAALALIAVSGLLVALTLGLAVVSLRRRLAAPGDPAPAPTPAD